MPELSPSPPSPNARSQSLKWVGAAALLGLLGLTLVVSWGWSLALSEDCRELPRADLTIEEMIAVKDQVDDFSRGDLQFMRFGGRGLSFLLRDHLRFPVWVEVREQDLVIQAASPWEEQCYNIDFEGDLEIHDGVAILHPDVLRVGELELADWVPDAGISVGPDRLSDPHAAEVLSQTLELRVRNGQVELRLRDVEALR